MYIIITRKYAQLYMQLSYMQLSVLEQDTEPQISPDVQLAPCMEASAISEYPAMSWRVVPWLQTMTWHDMTM